MNKKDLYTNYLSKLETALIEDEYDDIDYILEFIYTSWMPEKMIIEIDDILQEATLYSELKETEYKEQALKLIKEFK